MDATLAFVEAGAVAPPGSWAFEILDNTDDLRFYARHIFDGTPIGRVFAATDNLFGVNWQVCASHELLEMLVDPQLDQFALGPDGVKYDKEVCDPVQDDASGYLIGDTVVSDFVFPSWFDVNGSPPYDFCKRVIEPFEVIAKGVSMNGTGRARPGLGTRRAIREAMPSRFLWRP